MSWEHKLGDLISKIALSSKVGGLVEDALMLSTKVETLIEKSQKTGILIGKAPELQRALIIKIPMKKGGL